MVAQTSFGKGWRLEIMEIKQCIGFFTACPVGVALGLTVATEIEGGKVSCGFKGCSVHLLACCCPTIKQVKFITLLLVLKALQNQLPTLCFYGSLGVLLALLRLGKAFTVPILVSRSLFPGNTGIVALR